MMKQAGTRIVHSKYITSSTNSYDDYYINHDNPTYIKKSNSIEIYINGSLYIIFRNTDRGIVNCASNSTLYVSNTLGTFKFENPPIQFMKDLYTSCCSKTFKCYGYNKNGLESYITAYSKLYKHLPKDVIVDNIFDYL